MKLKSPSTDNIPIKTSVIKRDIGSTPKVTRGSLPNIHGNYSPSFIIGPPGPKGEPGEFDKPPNDNTPYVMMDGRWEKLVINGGNF